MSDDLEPWDFQTLLNSMSPAAQRNHGRRMFVVRSQMRLMRIFRWGRWPILNLVWVFWSCVMEEGIRNTCKPRWGALTFSYLNDGMKPTLYHTILSLLRTDTPLYPSGAPTWKNRKNEH